MSTSTSPCSPAHDVIDPGNDPLHQSSLSLRVVRKLPLVIVHSPERVVLNLAFILIGFSGIFADEAGTILATWPAWVLAAWGLGMVSGGASVLWGMFRHLTSVERLGYVLVTPACLVYAFSALWTRGASGLPVFLIFLGLACAKIIRMIISSAARDMTIEYGQRMDREQSDES